MTKAYLFATNPTSQTITGGGVVDLGGPVHGFGQTCCNKTIDVSGDNLTLRECGLYDFVMTGVLSDDAEGDVTLTPYVNGTPVSGVQTSGTIAAANAPAPFALTFAVRVPKCGQAVVTLVATSTAGNPIVVNVSTTAEKVQ